MSQQSVLICGLAQNCASRLPGMMAQLERLGELFDRYNIVVVENDSSDNSAELLQNWSVRNSKVSITRFSTIDKKVQQSKRSTNSPGWFSAERIQRICFARNIYLEQIGSYQADYVIVVDMDLLAFSLAGICSSFARPNDWQAVASNGLRYSLRKPFSRQIYWDTYAFEPECGFVDDTQSLAELRKSQGTLVKLMQNGNWCITRSAFGGLCIYQASLFEEVQYSVLPNPDQQIPWLCEHVGLHRAIRETFPAFRVHINPIQAVEYETALESIARTMTEGMKQLWK